MPNIKSAKKRVALSKAAYEKNKADKSALKTAVKKFEAAVASGNREQADSAYKAAVKSVDQGVKKGILHKNNANAQPAFHLSGRSGCHVCQTCAVAL